MWGGRLVCRLVCRGSLVAPLPCPVFMPNFRSAYRSIEAWIAFKDKLRADPSLAVRILLDDRMRFAPVQGISTGADARTHAELAVRESPAAARLALLSPKLAAARADETSSPLAVIALLHHRSLAPLVVEGGPEVWGVSHEGMTLLARAAHVSTEVVRRIWDDPELLSLSVPGGERVVDEIARAHPELAARIRQDMPHLAPFGDERVEDPQASKRDGLRGRLAGLVRRKGRTGR